MRNPIPLDKHQLVTEFRKMLTDPIYSIPENTQGIVVLSASPLTDSDGTVIKEDSPDNVARIVVGIELARKVAASRSNSPIEEANLLNAPPLILNGETEQLPMMEKVARQHGYPIEMIELVDCGKRGIGNTKTQFEVMNTDERFKDLKHLTFVTASYHALRTERTADKQLDPDKNFEVIPVSPADFPFSIFMLRGEIRRMMHYSQKGDISRNPTRPVQPLVPKIT